MNDVVATLSDPNFFISDAEHELHKRKLSPSGCKEDLLSRLFEALETEYAEGWTLGYLLNTKIIPFNGRGRDPRSLIGHHVAAYESEGAGVMILRLSDGEDMTLLSNNQHSHDESAKIKMDHNLFWALHTLDRMTAVPHNLIQKPLLITEAATGVRKDRWGKEAGNVFGLKLEGMEAPSFFFLAGRESMREDRICGDVWLAENKFLREDIRMLHGADETVVSEEEVRDRRLMEEEEERIKLKEDIRALHGG